MSRRNHKWPKPKPPKKIGRVCARCGLRRDTVVIATGYVVKYRQVFTKPNGERTTKAGDCPGAFDVSICLD